MNKKIKVGVLKVILTLSVVVLVQVLWQRYYDSLEKRYVIGKVIEVHPLLRQGVHVKFEYKIYGLSEIKSFPRENFNPKKGELYLVEVPINDRRKAKILLDHPVADSIQSPWDGWSEIPEFILLENQKELLNIEN